MGTYLDETAQIARQWDASRERSRQTALGISELSGCRQAIGYKLAGDWETDVTDTWRAIVGTAMHEWMTETRAAALPHLRHYERVEYRGTPGTPDEVDTEADRVAEWKFPRLSTSNLWRNDPEAFDGKRMQAHTYAAALVDLGVLTPECTVVVCVMPADGTYADWWTHEEPFDRATADRAADRRDEVEKLLADDMPLPRDKPFTWCEQYCEFFQLCRGRSSVPENEPITDPEAASAVRQYGHVLAELKPLEKRKKELAGEIRGLAGTVGDPEDGDAWRVAMTKPTGVKVAVDWEAVEQQARKAGWRLPTREVATSSPSLRVTKLKPKGSK